MNVYIIWRNKDDKIVAHGTRQQIAKQMGKNVGSIDKLLHRARAGENEKYTIMQYDEGKE